MQPLAAIDTPILDYSIDMRSTTEVAWRVL